MRSVFSRIALTLRNIHLGGAFSGIRSTHRSKSGPPELNAWRLARNPRDAAPPTAPPTINDFFIFHASFLTPPFPSISPTQYLARRRSLLPPPPPSKECSF